MTLDDPCLLKTDFAHALKPEQSRDTYCELDHITSVWSNEYQI